MYDLLHALLSDKTAGDNFEVFGFWHFFYIVLTFAGVVAVLLLLRGKTRRVKAKTAQIFLNAAVCLYAADFFLMPLAYGEISIEKLPFHVCTAMCVMCFLSCHVHFLRKFRLSFVLLGLLGNAVYLFFPAGVMWYEIHPFSYRVIQTMLFHSVMCIYGFATLAMEYKSFDIKKCHLDLAVVAGMVLWALLGNYAYSADLEGYSYSFNWFFVVRDPFNWFPESISPVVMPFLVLVLFSAAELLIHWILWCLQKRSAKAAKD